MSRTCAPPTVVVDTREQSPWVPWVWREGHRVVLPCVRRALVAGDYTIEGYEQEIAIERKSLADWIGTMFGATVDALGERATSWERFRREIVRALEGVTPTDGSAPTPALQRFVVVIEASREHVKRHDYRSGVLPQSVLGRSDSLLTDHNIHVEWAGDRAEAERYAMWQLVRWWERREREKGATGGDIARAFRLAAKAAAPVVPATTGLPAGMQPIAEQYDAGRLGLAAGRSKRA